MKRLVCNHEYTANQRFVTPDGRQLTFVRGVMDVSDDDLAFMRRNVLFGSVILEGDIAAPAHTELTPGEVVNPENAAIHNLIEEMKYCDLCDKTFSKEINYRRHMAMKHPELQADDEEGGAEDGG